MVIRRFMIGLAAGVMLAGAAIAAEVQTAAVTQGEAEEWIRHTVPLPKQIEITGKVTVPAEEVVVRTVEGSDPLVRQAAIELYEALGMVIPPAGGGKRTFQLVLTLGGAEAEGLKGLPNGDQAYRIVPIEGGLRLTAAGRRGVYYASKTMQQLIQARIRDGRAEIPIVKVTDWPDMEDRGLWGSDASNHLRWMSDRKMNYIEHISSVRVDKDKGCRVSLSPYKQRMIDEGPTYGINPVPVILHLEQLKGTGLFEAYPELQGKGATEGVICFSQPAFADVLTEWLVLWGKTPGVQEVDVWMTENMYGKTSCQCDACKEEDPIVLDMRTILKAYEQARRRVPELGLRVLTSEATEKSNPTIIPMLPREVKLWYYHSLFTYNTSRAPMIGKYQPYLIEAVGDGRWVGICPNLCAFVGLWQPMTSAAFIHGRMNEYVGKGLRGLIGYSVPRVYFCWFNTEAAAEWTWNARGRSTREFAASYAVRQGYADPEKFAKWSEPMGPVAWDVYGSDFPSGEQRNQPGKLAELLKEGKLPELGYVLWDLYGMPFGDIKTIEQLNDNVASAAKGVALARALGLDEYLHESLVIEGYMQAIKALWELKQVVKPEGVTDKAAAAKWFQAYAEALGQAREHLPLWEKSLPGREPGEALADKAVKLLGGMIEEMKATAQGFGISSN